MLSKPRALQDLLPPFTRIGDEGWVEALRAKLEAHGVPLPVPLTEDELQELGWRVGAALPRSLRTFLGTFGPVDFDGLRVLTAPEHRRLDGIWFADSLTEPERARLASLVAVFDYLGSGDVVAWDTHADTFVLVAHDPAGVHPWLPTFDDCIRLAWVELATGVYGWPDEEVEQLVAQARSTLFPDLDPESL